MIEIIIHGRGGEGAKTAAFMLAEAAILEGLYAQAFPEYGPERSGAPVRAFVRISDKPIYTHSPITNPDIVVVINPTLIDRKENYDGLKDKGVVILNTDKPINLGFDEWILDATRISLDTLGRPITNIPMMGALIRATNIVKPESFEEVIKTHLAGKGEETVHKNIEAFKRSIQEVKHV